MKVISISRSTTASPALTRGAQSSRSHVIRRGWQCTCDNFCSKHSIFLVCICGEGKSGHGKPTMVYKNAPRCIESVSGSVPTCCLPCSLPQRNAATFKPLVCGFPWSSAVQCFLLHRERPCSSFVAVTRVLVGAGEYGAKNAPPKSSRCAQRITRCRWQCSRQSRGGGHTCRLDAPGSCGSRSRDACGLRGDYISRQLVWCGTRRRRTNSQKQGTTVRHSRIDRPWRVSGGGGWSLEQCGIWECA